jgi:hypothetical protein
MRAEVLRDWVVAFVDDEAITHSELQETIQKDLWITPDIKTGEVLNTMINRVLIMREAKNTVLAASSEEVIMNIRILR